MPIHGVLVAALAWQGCPWCDGHMWGGGWGMWLFWLVVLAVVLWAVWTFARRGSARGPFGNDSDTAERLLRERYARGEIDEATFRRMMDELRR